MMWGGWGLQSGGGNLWKLYGEHFCKQRSAHRNCLHVVFMDLCHLWQLSPEGFLALKLFLGSLENRPEGRGLAPVLLRRHLPVSTLEICFLWCLELVCFFWSTFSPFHSKIKVWDLQAALDPRAPASTLCLRTLVVCRDCCICGFTIVVYLVVLTFSSFYPPPINLLF